MYIYIYTCIYIYIHTYMYIYIYVKLCKYVLVHVYLYYPFGRIPLGFELRQSLSSGHQTWLENPHHGKIMDVHE